MRRRPREADLRSVLNAILYMAWLCVHGLVCNTQEDLQAAWQMGEYDRSATEQVIVDKVNEKVGKPSCITGDFYASIGDTVGEIGEKTRGAVRKMEIDAVWKDGMCLTSKPFEAYGAFPLQGNNT
jgi:hypothetical protein